MPSAAIRISKTGTRTIFSPKVSLTYQNCEELAAAFKDCVTQHKTEVILDCKLVRFLDSAVLELLVRMHDDLKSNGGKLKIIGLNDVCREILYATRLADIFNVFKDLYEAIAHDP